MVERYRQEVFNVLLAQLLQERGVVSAPESMVTLVSGTRRRVPDVIVDYRGLRTAIEGEVDDARNAGERALAKSASRVEEGIAHIGIAVVYPARLRGLDFQKLKTEIAESELQIAVATESGRTGFILGNVNQLHAALRDAFERLVQEDIVNEAVAALDEGIERFARVMVTRKGDLGRVAHCLGIRELRTDRQNSEADE